MKLLFKMAIGNRKHLTLFVFSLIAMCILTFASQLEILSLGIMAQKGPGFLELFAEKRDSVGIPAVTKSDLEERWELIDRDKKGYITKQDIDDYYIQSKRGGFVERTIALVKQWIPFDKNILFLAFMMAFVGFFKAISLFSHRFSTRLIAIRVSRDLRQRYFEHIQSLPLNFYQKYHIGSLSSRVVTDAYVIAEGINAIFVNFLQTPFTVGTTLTLCFLTSWQLSLVIFFGFPLILYPIVFIAKKVKKITKQLQKNQESFATVLIDFLSGIQTVKVFAMEEFSLKKYRDQNHKMAALEQKSARYDVSSRPIVHTLAMFFLSGALIWGLYGLNMATADILVYCGFLYILYEPVKKFAEENSIIQKGIAASERMSEVLNIKPEIQDRYDAGPLDTLHTSIEFDDVWFRYENEWILKGVSFQVKKGETVAIAGPTGSGKSTIVQLLPRLYDIQKGEIRINDKSLNCYTQRSLRENIAFVPQKPFLFLDTIAENISFGRPYPREKIHAAARQAHAEEFIERLPNKYDTELAESGKNLSGGQQQRLAIARALLKDAPILILDEATSSLDNISEGYIKDSIRQLHGKMTQIIIAHRLSTIENADKIIYLENGKKMGEGTKEELLNSCPGFKAMWEKGNSTD
jgi:putative ABC transport system ATP-binding protein